MGSARAVGTTVDYARLGIWLDRGLEAIWLTAAVFVPLVVLPETAFISITDLPKVVLLRLLASASVGLLAARALAGLARTWSTSGPDTAGDGRLSGAAQRLRFGPGAWVVAAALAVLLATALSAALSIAPALSVWGKDPARDGYSLYTTAAYVALFLAVALRVRSPAQVWRLAGAIAAAGILAALLGIAQHWGLAPLGISATAGHRVTGPAGNPIFLGALLVMTLPLMLGAAAAYAARFGTSRAWWALTVAGGFAHMFATVAASSRMPMAALAVSAAIFLAGAWWKLGRRVGLSLAGALAAAVVLTFAASFLPAASVDPRSTRTGDFGPIASGFEGVQERISGAMIAGGLEARRIRWEPAARLLVRRPEIVDATNRPAPVRALVGYGPDMFRYAFPLEAPAKLANLVTDAAHNDALTRGVELGALGLLAYAVLGVSLAAALWARLRRSAAAGTGEAAVAVALAAAFAGHGAEQLTGIARVGDSLTFWLLAGLAAAMAASFNAAPATSRRRIPIAPQRGAVLAAGAMALALLLAGAAVLAWVKNVAYLEADADASATRAAFATDPASALRRIDRAIELAPDVPDYRHRKAAMLRALADATRDSARADALREQAYENDLAALAINPLSRRSNFVAADSAWSIARAGRPEEALKAVRIYERLARLTPQHPDVKPRLAALYDALGITPPQR